MRMAVNEQDRQVGVSAVLGAALCILVISCGAGNSSAAEHSAIIERLDSAIRYEMEAKALPAFSIALADDNGEVWSSGYGYTDVDKKVPATADTVFRVGSVSKLFTDIAVMQLVEAGKLDLDRPVQEYLPTFAPHNPFDVPITLRQLMSHRAGLVRESPVGNYFDPDEPTLEATVKSLNETTLVYKPGTRTKYSNAGIAVVGAVLEQQLGIPFSRRVDEAILQPLGMHDTNFLRTPDIDKKLSAAYMWTYDGRRFVAPKFLLGTAPAGNLYASVRDMTRFLACLFHDGKAGDYQLLKPETLRQMMTAPVSADGKPQSYGIGFHVDKFDGQLRIGHGGAVYGFSTEVAALPESKIGVAAVSTLDVSHGTVSRLADFALRLMLAERDGKPLPEYRTTSPLPAARAKELTGDFGSDGRTAHLTELYGRAWMLEGVFLHELRTAAEDGKLLGDDPINFGTTVGFDDDRNLIAGKTTFQRRPDAPPSAVPERWGGLIGEYGWDHNTLYILEDHGQLYALIEWFHYYPLKELSNDEFAFPDSGLYHGEKLKFTRDDEGNATQVVAAEVTFRRRPLGDAGATFKIEPVKPIDELRAAALAATPPAEEGTFREPELVELVTLDPTIKLDIRYASTNNFAGAVFYKQARAFMQRPAAEALVRVHQRLKKEGLGLLVHDAYRPWYVTKMFWDATPAEFKDFVANPATGSRHNRGCAVDLSLYDLSTGEPIPMVAGYDEFSPRSLPMYPGGTARQRWYRDHLRYAMQTEGFEVYEFEWWHFDFRDWKHYRIGNATFEDLLGEAKPVAAPKAASASEAEEKQSKEGCHQTAT